MHRPFPDVSIDSRSQSPNAPPSDVAINYTSKFRPVSKEDISTSSESMTSCTTPSGTAVTKTMTLSPNVTTVTSSDDLSPDSKMINIHRRSRHDKLTPSSKENTPLLSSDTSLMSTSENPIPSDLRTPKSSTHSSSGGSTPKPKRFLHDHSGRHNIPSRLIHHSASKPRIETNCGPTHPPLVQDTSAGGAPISPGCGESQHQDCPMDQDPPSPQKMDI